MCLYVPPPSLLKDILESTSAMGRADRQAVVVAEGSNTPPSLPLYPPDRSPFSGNHGNISQAEDIAVDRHDQRPERVENQRHLVDNGRNDHPAA
jgi:hypothetical protein